MLLPAVGAFADDETGLADDLESFTDEFDRIDALVASGTVTQGDLDALARVDEAAWRRANADVLTAGTLAG